MKYYKILDNEDFIGVINSNNFKNYYIKSNFLGPATEINGQLVELKGKLYRDTWMNSAINVPFPYKTVAILRITEEEYKIYYEAAQIEDAIERQKYIDEQQPIINPPEDNQLEPEPIINPEPSVEYLKSIKIKEMSAACNKTIEDGFYIELNGEICHFSLTVQDQLNLITLSSMVAQGLEQIPYHADGELCKFYTPEEINSIVERATYYKTYHITYYNALKSYIKSLNDINTISKITYGIEIPEKYQTEVLKSLL